MKLHLDQSPSLNTVTAYGDNYFDVNAVRYQHSVLLMPSGQVEKWPINEFSQLTGEHFLAMLGRQPEVILIGTGRRQRFVHPRLWAPLAERHLGVEAMDTAAACRTYNILMTEGRLVLAALILEG
jgi:uncharacterized protein